MSRLGRPLLPFYRHARRVFNRRLVSTTSTKKQIYEPEGALPDYLSDDEHLFEPDDLPGEGDERQTVLQSEKQAPSEPVSPSTRPLEDIPGDEDFTSKFVDEIEEEGVADARYMEDESSLDLFDRTFDYPRLKREEQLPYPKPHKWPASWIVNWTIDDIIPWLQAQRVLDIKVYDVRVSYSRMGGEKDWLIFGTAISPEHLKLVGKLMHKEGRRRKCHNDTYFQERTQRDQGAGFNLELDDYYAFIDFSDTGVYLFTDAARNHPGFGRDMEDKWWRDKVGTWQPLK